MDEFLRALLRKYQLSQDPLDAIRLAEFMAKIEDTETELHLLLVFYGENDIPSITVHATRDGLNERAAHLIMEDCEQNIDFINQSQQPEMIAEYEEFKRFFQSANYAALVDLYVRRPLLNTVYVILTADLNP